MSKILIKIMEWMMHLAYLNILWLLFSIPLVTLPASTAALFSTLKNWSNNMDESTLLTTYWTQFKRNFKDSYKIGLPLILVATILWIDLMLLYDQSTSLVLIFRYGAYVLIILFIMTALFVFPVSIRFNFPWYKQFFTAFMLSIGNPLITLLSFCGIILVIVVSLLWPGLGIFFIGSLTAMIIHKATDFALMRVHK